MSKKEKTKIIIETTTIDDVDKTRVKISGDEHNAFISTLGYIIRYFIVNYNENKKDFLKKMGLTYDLIKEELESNGETNE